MKIFSIIFILLYTVAWYGNFANAADSNTGEIIISHNQEALKVLESEINARIQKEYAERIQQQRGSRMDISWDDYKKNEPIDNVSWDDEINGGEGMNKESSWNARWNIVDIVLNEKTSALGKNETRPFPIMFVLVFIACLSLLSCILSLYTLQKLKKHNW